MKNWTGKNWFVFMTVFAFASLISFFQIYSAKADAHHLNGFYTVLGIVFGLIAIFGLKKTAENSN